MGVAEDQIKKAFPGLADGDFKLSSPRCSLHNCIAFAAGKKSQKWWPIGGYWPPGIPRAETVDAFEKAFATLGYERCADSKPEKGYDKVALYTDPFGKPKHMARQLQDRWHSKLGDGWDIIHKLEAVEGKLYGTATVFLRRKSATQKNKAKRRRKHGKG